MANIKDNEDGDLCDNWEDIIENGVLDKKLANMKVDSNEQSKSKDGKTGNLFNITVLQENGIRTQYVPPEPSVRILRRPDNNSEVSNSTTDKSPSRQNVKTLQQREAEYAEARKRIMGCEGDGGVIATEQINRPVSVKKQKEVDAVKIIREPTGPDGSSGFSQKR